MLDIKITRVNDAAKQTITNISYTPEDKDIDNIVYYLICAAEKLNSDNQIEKTLAIPRLERAFHDLRTLIKKTKEEDTYETRRA